MHLNSILYYKYKFNEKSYETICFLLMIQFLLYSDIDFNQIFFNTYSKYQKVEKIPNLEILYRNADPILFFSCEDSLVFYI